MQKVADYQKKVALIPTSPNNDMKLISSVI